MNCNECIEKLDEYLDGELPEAQALEWNAHVAACDKCMTLLERAERLRRQAAALPRELEPANDLWPAIAARVELPVGTRPWLRGLAAAIALVAVFAGGMLADRVMRDAGDNAPRLVQDDAGKRDLPNVGQARRMLPASHVELIEGGASGGTTEQELLRNLLLVNLAIREVETAAAADPANANLRELLSSLYAQEHRILGQAERLRVVGQAPTRTGI